MLVAAGPDICLESVRLGCMDESHLRAAVSYVSLNPVRARLVSRAEEWSWSSVRAHLAGEDDSLVSVRPVLDRWPHFRELLLQDDDEAFTSLRKAEGIGCYVPALPHGLPLRRVVHRKGTSMPRCGFHVPILGAAAPVAWHSPTFRAETSHKVRLPSKISAPGWLRSIVRSAIFSIVVAVGAVCLVVLRNHLASSVSGDREDINEQRHTNPDGQRPTQYNSLPTGTRIEEDIGTNGCGELTADNGTTEDAVVRLSDTGDNALRYFS
jgi:hypothetical protein